MEKCMTIRRNALEIKDFFYNNCSQSAAHWFSFIIISLNGATYDPFLKVNVKSAI